MEDDEKYKIIKNPLEDYNHNNDLNVRNPLENEDDEGDRIIRNPLEDDKIKNQD